MAEGVQQRRLGFAGIAFVVLLVVSIFLVPNAPQTNASAAKIVSYYHDHKAGLVATSFVIELAVFVGVAFFWYLREHLAAAAPAGRRLLTLGFAGGLIFAISGAVAAGISFALADHVGHIDPTVTQVLNVFSSDVSPFMGAPGIALFLGATGVVIITSKALPVWLGWAGVVLAVVALVVGFFGLLGVGLWILATSITLLVRADRPQAS